MRLFLPLTLLMLHALSAQESFSVNGLVLDNYTKKALSNVVVSVEGSSNSVKTVLDGSFSLLLEQGSYIISISLNSFTTKRIPVSIDNIKLTLGELYLERDVILEKTDNLITITDSDLSNDEGASITTGLLQATRDVFLNRAAFDFGQAFFRVRGYDSQNGMVLINGIPMNKFYDGRPQWNNWGGLNDITRNQQFTNGLEASDYTFGGILGNTNIDVRPSGLRAGTRVSSSASNRTYTGRAMVTHTFKNSKKGLAYSLSGSRRSAKQGYIQGTLYDAFSFFAAVEYQINKKHSFSATGILASNRRGRSSALTEEVFNLIGKQYNPYWGKQDGDIRNSRERNITEPILMLNHFYEAENFTLSTGIAYQFGKNSRSRLGYYNAPNPDPTYYRYLPSFYINSPIGANFSSANSAKDGFLENPQLDWENVYAANSNGEAAYVLYDDVANDKQLTFNMVGNVKLNTNFRLDFGGTFKKLISNNYAKIFDLLGADFHQDIDAFSNTLNDVNGNEQKAENDIFNYHYILDASAINTFLQLKFDAKSWNGFAAVNFIQTNYQRNGLFLNERFLENSLGQGEKVSFSDLGLKGGMRYKITGRHWITVNAAHINRAPVLQNVFINPRENNELVPNLKSENITSLDLNYFMRLPKLTGRVTGFYTRFTDLTDVNFFFVDAGVGSDFVQEVVTDLDKLHLGTEIGFEYQLSSAVKLTAVAAISKYVYANNPAITINFDTAGAEEDLINPDGNIDLGLATIKDYKLAQGPQQAYALGVEYRDPKYWWIAATTNYLADNYANISTITRTQSFLLDPETNQPFFNATAENVNKLLEQRPLDNFYLLNLVGGKSWLKSGKYISVFASVNNLFDSVFRTGGFEQSRNGNFGQLQQDNLSGTPSFAPKYWYGYGRTYFLNVAFSF